MAYISHWCVCVCECAREWTTTKKTPDTCQLRAFHMQCSNSEIAWPMHSLRPDVDEASFGPYQLHCTHSVLIGPMCWCCWLGIGPSVAHTVANKKKTLHKIQEARIQSMAMFVPAKMCRPQCWCAHMTKVSTDVMEYDSNSCQYTRAAHIFIINLANWI